MITYQLSVTQGFPLPCTEDIWNEIIDRPAVKNICDQIAALDPEAPDFNDRKQDPTSTTANKRSNVGCQSSSRMHVRSLTINA